MFGAITPQLDPHLSLYSNEAQIFTAIYEGLFSYDPATLEPVPAAAESWTRSADGKEYRFSIRPEATWSDGSPLTSGDFRLSWLRLLEGNASYAAFFDIVEGAERFRMGLSADPDSVGVLAPDEKTLILKLNRPADYLPALLCHHAFAPIHPSMLAEADWASKISFPVNGPYKIDSFSDAELKLSANPRYWDSESVAIPFLDMKFLDDPSDASRMFNNDEAQWLAGEIDFDAILIEQAIQINPIFSTHYWYFDCSRSPWDSASVRRALALLLPWKEIRDPERYSMPASTLVLPLPYYSSVKGIVDEDREEALRLLAEAGFPGGSGLPEITVYFADGAEARRIAALFRTSWESLDGVKVVLKPVKPALYYDAIGREKNSGAVTLSHTTWIGDFADPEAFLQMWTEGSPLNDSHFTDPEFVAAMYRSYEATGSARLGYLAQAETALLQSAAALPIYHSLAIQVVDLDYIDGWYQNALDIHPYKYLRFGEPSVKPNLARSGDYATLAAVR